MRVLVAIDYHRLLLAFMRAFHVCMAVTLVGHPGVQRGKGLTMSAAPPLESLP